MLFSEAVAQVQEMVKRPDKALSIKREINSAISLYCLDNRFSQDFAEQSISINPSEYSQNFALSTMTRWREFRYIKRGGTKKFLEKFSDAELLKGCFDRDKYYIAGNAVVISMIETASTLDVGYWRYPPTLTGAQNSDSFWLLDIAPYMIIDKAAANIFKQIGQEKDWQLHSRQALESYMAVRKDLINQ